MRISRLAFFIALLGSAEASADDLWPWQRLDVPDRPAARFSFSSDRTLRVEAESAVGFLYRPLAAGEIADGIAWRWRLDAAPSAGPLDVKGKDDRPLAVHVAFRRSPETGLFDGMARRLRRLFAGKLFEGRMITYVFGGTHPEGAHLPNPFLPKDAAIVVLRAKDAPMARWLDEQVDPMADYKAIFGTDPPPAAFLIVSSDTDDRGGLARGAIEFLNVEKETTHGTHR